MAIQTVTEALKDYETALAEQTRLWAAYQVARADDALDQYNTSCTILARAKAVLRAARRAASPPIE